MEKVRPWCGQSSDRGQLEIRSDQIRSELIKTVSGIFSNRFIDVLADSLVLGKKILARPITIAETVCECSLCIILLTRGARVNLRLLAVVVSETKPHADSVVINRASRTGLIFCHLPGFVSPAGSKHGCMTLERRRIFNHVARDRSVYFCYFTLAILYFSLSRNALKCCTRNAIKKTSPRAIWPYLLLKLSISN